MVPVTTNQDVGEAVVKSYIFSSYLTTTEASKKTSLTLLVPPFLLVKNKCKSQHCSKDSFN